MALSLDEEAPIMAGGLRLRAYSGSVNCSLHLKRSGHGRRAGTGLAAAELIVVLAFGDDWLAGFGHHAQVARLQLELYCLRLRLARDARAGTRAERACGAPVTLGKLR